MTSLCGVVALDRARPVPRSLVGDLAAALTRDPGDQVHLLEGTGHAFATLDLGVLDGPGRHVDEAGRVTLLAGTPLLEGSAAGARRNEVVALHCAWQEGDQASLRHARGTFCGVHFDPAARRLRLVGDRLGSRPLYFVADDGYLFVSTALRVLESLPALRLSGDLRGVAEIAAFGFPLGSRSPYIGVSTIGPAEVVDVCPSGTTRVTYWRWSDLPEAPLPREELAPALFRVFHEAVRRRLGSRRTAVVFLSGGLDSRCVAACLRLLGAEVRSLNFAEAGSEDHWFARDASRALGTRHFEWADGPVDVLDRMHSTHAAWLEQTPPESLPDDPRLVWSGDGGECVLGPVSFTKDSVRLMREGPLDRAVDAYCQASGGVLPRRVFTPTQRARLQALPRAGLHEELAGLKSFDEARRFHLFMLLNEERRRRAAHYEDIDRRRFELVLPFYDPELLTLVLSQPIDHFLGHAFYHRWLAEFPPETRSAPWQTYPGHEPCALPKPPGVYTQWDPRYGRRHKAARTRALIARIERALDEPGFPDWLVRRSILRLAGWLTRLGVVDLTYLLVAADVFVRYVRNGRPGAAVAASPPRCSSTCASGP